MSNALTSYYRQNNPDDPRTDDQITLDYARQHKPEQLDKYTGFTEDLNRILREMYPPTVGEMAKNVYGNLVRGALNTAATIPESVGILAANLGQSTVPGGSQLTAPEIGSYSDLGLRDLAQKLTPEQDPTLADSFWLSKVPQGVGSTVGFMGAGILGKLAGLNPTAVTALTGAAAGGVQGYEDAQAHDATADKALSSFVLNALAGSSEALPISNLMSRLDKMAGGGIKKAILEVAKQGGEEAAQEAFQQAVGNAIAKGIVKYDPERGWYEGVGENAAIGFISGAIMSGGVSVLEQAGRKPQEKKVDPVTQTTTQTPTQTTEFREPEMAATLAANLTQEQKQELAELKQRQWAGSMTDADRQALEIIRVSSEPIDLEKKNYLALLESQKPVSAKVETPTAEPVAAQTTADTATTAPLVEQPQPAPQPAPQPIIQEVIPNAEVQRQETVSPPVPTPQPAAGIATPAAGINTAVRALPWTQTPVDDYFTQMALERARAAQQSRAIAEPAATPVQPVQPEIAPVINNVTQTPQPVPAEATPQPVAAPTTPPEQPAIPPATPAATETPPIAPAVQPKDPAHAKRWEVLQSLPRVEPARWLEIVDFEGAKQHSKADVKAGDNAAMAYEEFDGEDRATDIKRLYAGENATLFSPEAKEVRADLIAKGLVSTDKAVADEMKKRKMKPYANTSGWTRKLGVFTANDGSHVLVAGVNINAKRKWVSAHSIIGKNTGVELMDLFNPKLPYNYTLTGALLVKDPVKNFSAIYSPEEWSVVKGIIADEQLNLAKLGEEMDDDMAPTATDEEGNEFELKRESASSTVDLKPDLLELIDKEIWYDGITPKDFKQELFGKLEQDDYRDIWSWLISGYSKELVKYPTVIKKIQSKEYSAEFVTELIAQHIYEEIKQSGINAESFELFEVTPERIKAAAKASANDGAGSQERGDTAEGQPAAAEAYTFSSQETARVSPVSQQVTDLIEQLKEDAEDYGLTWKIISGVAQEYGSFDKARRIVSIGMVDANQPTMEHFRMGLHEVGHAVTSNESAAVQAAAHRAIDAMTDEQLGITQTTDPRLRNPAQSGLTPSQLSEERLAEHLALQGIQQAPARSIASRIIRALKDLYYRLAMALQKAWGRTLNPRTALAYVENRFSAVMNGQPGMSLWEAIVPPMPMAKKLREVYTPAHEAGWYAERADMETGQVVYGETVDGPLQFTNVQLLAPNGKPSNLTPGQWRQVRTPEFKAWFGDWENDPKNASKVVDENGEPKVVYHGTDQDFDAFSKKFLGKSTNAFSAEEAFFFSDNPGVAESYGQQNGGRTMAAYREKIGEIERKISEASSNYRSDKYRRNLWIEHDRLSAEMAREMVSLANQDERDQQLRFIEGSSVMPVYLNVRNPLIVEYNGGVHSESPFTQNILKAKEVGHDGVLFKNVIDDPDALRPSNVWAVFKPTQIKSAIGNRGTFDSTNPNILFTHSTREPLGTPQPRNPVVANHRIAVANTELDVQKAAFESIVNLPEVQQFLKDNEVKDSGQWFRTNLGLRDPNLSIVGKEITDKDGKKVMVGGALNEIDPITGKPVEANKDQRIEDFLSEDNRDRAYRDALQLVRRAFSAVSRKTEEYGEWIKKNTEKVTKAVNHLADSTGNFTDVDGLTAEVAQGVRAFLVRGLGDLANINRNPGVVIQQIRALAGNMTQAQRAEYETALRDLFADKEFLSDTFDVLDAAQKDKIDFSKDIKTIRNDLLALNKRDYDTLTNDSVTANAKLAATVAYAKSHAWLLTRAELRGSQDLTERQRIVESLRKSLEDKALNDEVNAVGKAGTLTERALAAYRAEKRKVRSLKFQLQKMQALRAAGLKAMEFYKAEQERLSTKIDAYYVPTYGDGMKYHVIETNPDGTTEFVEKRIHTTANQKITDIKEVERDMANQFEWLKQQEAAGIKNGRYLQIKAEHEEIMSKGLVSDDVINTKFRMWSLYLSDLATQMTSLGTPESRRISQMMKVYAGKRYVLLSEANRLGIAVEKATYEAVSVLGKGAQSVEMYKTNFWEPCMRYLESRRDLLEQFPNDPKKQMDSAFADFERWLTNLPPMDARKAALEGKIPQFVKALRKHVEAEEAANQFLVDHNIDRVIDPKLGGMTRKRFRVGLITHPVGMSHVASSIFLAMHNSEGAITGAAGADWGAQKDHTGNKIDNPAAADFGRAAGVYRSLGADAAKKLISPYFDSDIIQRHFLNELAIMQPGAFCQGPLLSDGVTRPDIDPGVVQQAWMRSGGDVVSWAQQMHKLARTENTTEDVGDYLGYVLSQLLGYASELETSYRRANPSALQSRKAFDGMIPEMMVHARTIEHYPAAWRKHISFDRHAMTRAIDMVAATEAFGLEHKSLKEAFKTVHNEASIAAHDWKMADKMVKDSVGGRVLKASEYRREMRKVLGSEERYQRLKKAQKRFEMVQRFEPDLVSYFRGQHTMPDELRLSQRLIRFFANMLLQQPGSALTMLADTSSIIREFGVSPKTVKASLRSVFYSTPRSLVGSLSQALSPALALPVRNQFRQAAQRIGMRDAAAWQDLGTQLKEPGVAGESAATKASRVLRKTEAVLQAGVGRTRGEQATEPLLRPGAIFTQAGLTMNFALAENSGLMVEEFVRQGMDVLKNDPAALQDPAWGRRLEDWIEPLGLNTVRRKVDGTRNTFERIFVMADSQYALNFGRLVREALERERAGQYILSDLSVERIISMSMNEVSLEGNPATMSMAQWSSAWVRFASPLLGWMFRHSMKVGRMGLDAKGGGRNWLQADVKDWEKSVRAIQNLAVMAAMGLAVGMMVDWYNEKLLGKRRNLRQLSTTASTKENLLAVLEQTTRVGTAGFLGEMLNTAINVGTGEGDNRGISLDQRVVGMSMALTLYRSLSTWFNQGFQAEYTSVVRPVLASTVGNSMLQYLDLFNNALGLDNAESRAVARTNVNNWLRSAGRVKEMEVRMSRGGYSTPTAYTPYITRMTLAAYANDPVDFQENYRAALELARSKGEPDPMKSIREKFQSRHPLRSVLRNVPDVREYRALLDAMPESGRKDVEEAVALFNNYGARIGLKPFTGSRPDEPSQRSNPFSMQQFRRAAFQGLSPSSVNLSPW